MRHTRKVLALVCACMSLELGIAQAQSASDMFQPLVATSSERLAIAEQVALAKWDSKTSVEDNAREAQVITGAVKAAKLKGLDEASVTNFFRAQIEANKLVQYSLLANWRRAGQAPAHTRVSLADTIRPQLDGIQTELINELSETMSLRGSPSCATDLAQATERYVSDHRGELTTLRTIALDRALADTCTAPIPPAESAGRNVR